MGNHYIDRNTFFMSHKRKTTICFALHCIVDPCQCSPEKKKLLPTAQIVTNVSTALANSSLGLFCPRKNWFTFWRFSNPILHAWPAAMFLPCCLANLEKSGWPGLTVFCNCLYRLPRRPLRTPLWLIWPCLLTARSLLTGSSWMMRTEPCFR